MKIAIIGSRNLEIEDLGKYPSLQRMKAKERQVEKEVPW